MESAAQEMRNYRDDSAKLAQPQSPLGHVMERNSEIISALEKQIEILANRLAPVINMVDMGSETVAEGESDRKPSSSTVEALYSQGNRMMRISDNISLITRNLEV